MTGYLTLGVAAIALGAIALTGVQSVRLADAQSDLATVTTQLTDARRDRDQAVRDRQLATHAMTVERDAALAAEIEASSLRERIARDAGTSRDGETAPVLRETIQGLRRSDLVPSDRMLGPNRTRSPASPYEGRFLRTGPDADFIGRMLPPFRLVVTVDGRQTATAVVRGFVACRDLAASVATDLAKRAELVSNPRRASIRCLEIVEGDRA